MRPVVPTKFIFGLLIPKTSEASKDGGPGALPRKIFVTTPFDRWKVPIFVKKSPLKEAVEFD